MTSRATKSDDSNIQLPPQKAGNPRKRSESVEQVFATRRSLIEQNGGDEATLWREKATQRATHDTRQTRPKVRQLTPYPTDRFLDRKQRPC